MHRCSLAQAYVGLCLTMPVGTAAVAEPPTVRYAVTDLGTLGGAQTEANAINDHGEVAGEADTVKGELHAFLWRNGHIQDLGTLGGGRSVAQDINDRGQIVGEAELADGRTHAFLWENGRMRDLGALGGTFSTATRITGGAEVIGFTVPKGSKSGVSFVWTERTGMRRLPASVLVGYSKNVSDRGEYVAYVRGNDGKKHARIGRIVGGIVQAASGVTLMDTSLPIRVVGLDGEGRAVGENGPLGLDGNFFPRPHAYLWTASSLIDLGSLGGQQFLARCVNGRDEVVGLAGVLVPGAKPYLSGALPETMHAFLWEQGQLHDLNSLVPAEDGWVLWDALGLNGLGQIVGTGLHHGRQHAFLLTPVGEAPAVVTQGKGS